MLFNVLYKHRHITQEWLCEIKIAICFCCCSGFSHLRVSPRSVCSFASPPVLTCHWHVVAKTYWEEALWQVQACPHSDKCNIPVTQVSPPACIPVQSVSFLTVCNSRYIRSVFLSLFFLFWGHTNAFVTLQHIRNLNKWFYLFKLMNNLFLKCLNILLNIMFIKYFTL